MDFFRGSHQQTSNTDLAAALGTVGIPRIQEQPLQVLVGEINSIIFYFQPVSACGHYKTQECISLWDDPLLDTNRPSHAITYIRAAMRSRSRLLEFAKGKSRVGVSLRPTKRFEIVHLPGDSNSTPKIPASSSVRPPDTATTPRLQTDDIELACALLSCGIPLWSQFPIERHPDSRISFFFHPQSPCGAYNTRELMLAWQDPHWHENNQEHPFAYLWCAFENRRRLMREIKLKNPMITFVRAGFPHFLSMNADSKTESAFMRAFKDL